MIAEQRTLTDREKLENALDQLGRLREQTRVHASLAGVTALAAFEVIDAELHEELAGRRAQKAALADVARKLKTLLVQTHVH